ncbi:MAG: hypothetical protein FJ257_01495 [Phycisphaerae bacterium]|nr:hypothetical protein [Phycisphaerae bacterium]
MDGSSRFPRLLGPTRTSLAAAILLAGVSTAKAQEPSPPPPRPQDRQADHAESPPAAPPSEAESGERRRGDRGARPGAPPWPRGGRGEREGDGSPRRLTPEQVEMVIEVAREVFPEWGERLEQMRASDPEALERAVASNARRLFSLAMLRRRNPELYELKVTELRNQMELRRLSEAMAALRGAGAEEEAIGALRAQIRVLATEQVDLELRTRALELAAMDDALRRMKDELATDTNARAASIDAMVEAIESGRPPADDPASGERVPGERRDRSAPRDRGPMPPPLPPVAVP